MRVGIGQINPHVGAIERNTKLILSRIAEARKSGCELVIFPELAIPGSSPLDLAWRPGFVTACEDAVETIRAASEGIGVLVGSITSEAKGEASNRFDLSALSDGADVQLYDVAYLIADRETLGCAAKVRLAAFDVYDDKRYFTPGRGVEVFPFRGMKLGINLGDDLWADEGPTEIQATLNANWIVNLSASPFYVGKPAIRRRAAVLRATENDVGILCVHLVGGQDGLVFDGGSFAVDATGSLVFQAPHFREGLYTVDLINARPIPPPHDDDLSFLGAAIVMGIRDYVAKNGFSSVLLGLSGGIDSALVATLAAEALDPEAVTGVFMPSEFTPTESREDASAVAQRLGIEYTEIPIDGVHRALRAAVPSATGVVDENLQPRIRATLLMAIANQHNALVLSSGNKSEGAMGYSTLYGDTAGALAPIGDLYKEDVYRLARTYENQIPRRIFDRPPSAELRPNQRDDEDLPPYEEIDAILRELIERNASRTQLIERGFAPTTVDDVLTRYYANEHKRRQSPPGIKVTPKTLGIGRRMPITNAYRK
jgi:NAD+ synthase (glutamine-hydrolysing)